jgi:hypothetical protein
MVFIYVNKGQFPTVFNAWASADFFPGESKKFPGGAGGGGQEPTFCLKNNEKDTILPKKSKNILFLAGQGGGQKPPLPSSADAHASMCLQLLGCFIYFS